MDGPVPPAHPISAIAKDIASRLKTDLIVNGCIRVPFPSGEGLSTWANGILKVGIFDIKQEPGAEG